MRRFRLKRRHLRSALMATAPTAALFGYAGMHSAGALEPVAVMAPLKGYEPTPLAPSAKPAFAERLGSVAASYYGDGFAGRPTASGETFDPAAMTAAHRTLPFGSLVEVKHAASGRSVVVRINDRGPFHGDRGIDLSEAAARAIGLAEAGVGRVDLSLLRNA